MFLLWTVVASPSLGQIDAVFANWGEPNRVCLNDGRGSFDCRDVSSDASTSVALALGDLDGTNGLDVVFANRDQRNRLCLNDGSGGFTCRDLGTARDRTTGVAIGDLDGKDGPDVVFANGDARNEVCFNDGLAGFSCRIVSGVLRATLAVAVAELDGHSGLDLVFGNVFAPNELCFNDGDASFDCIDMNPTETLSVAIAVGDLDQSHGEDLVFGNSSEVNRACLNDGSGGFACYDIEPGHVWCTEGVALADMDGVNGLDAVLADFPVGSGRVCLNDGTGHLTCGSASDPYDSLGLDLGNFDGQPGVDAIFANFGQRDRVCLNDGSGQLLCRDVEPSSFYGSDVAAGPLRFADLSITKTDKSVVAIPGGAVTYLITVSNAGPNPVPGALVMDLFPPELTCTWSCLGLAGATCTAGPVTGALIDTASLPVGGEVIYSASCAIDPSATGFLINRATVSGTSDPIPSNNEAVDVDALTPQADLGITKTDKRATAVPGEPLVYLITATNHGPGPVVGATVVDSFPSPLTCSWSCTPSPDATCTAGPQSGDLVDLVDLPVGGTASYLAECWVSPGAKGALINSATVAVPFGVSDPTLGNNQATDVDLLTPVANLTLTKDDGLSTVAPGLSTTYIIAAGNADGPSDAMGAILRDDFSPILDCVWSCAGSGGASCSQPSGSGDIEVLVDIPLGGSTLISATCDIDSASVGTLTNTATLSPGAGATDPSPADNTATDVNILAPESDLAASKDDGLTFALPGDTLAYEIVARNLGPSDALDAAIVDRFPAELADCSWTCTPASGASCTWGPVVGDLLDVLDLPSASWATYEATCTVASDDFLALVNSAILSTPPGVTDPDPSNNEATDENAGPGALVFADGFESGDPTNWLVSY